MKKIIAIILAALMLMSFVACTNNDTSNDGKESETVNNNNPAAPTDAELSANASIEEIANAIMKKYAEYTDFAEQFNTMVTEAKASFDKYNKYANLTNEEFDAFVVEMESDEELKSEFSYYASLGYDTFVSEVKAMADVYESQANMGYDEYFAVSFMINEVPAGTEWLQGFETAPTGYSEAYVYQPGMIGQAFIGYIFRVEEGTDMAAFKKSLVDNCNQRWNICTSANTTVCESFGDLVYFSMMVVEGEDEMMGGFTAEQKEGFYNTFVETIKSSAK